MHEQGIKVTFLGRIPEAAEERLMMRGGVRAKVDEYIKQRSKKWKFPWQVLKDMDAQVCFPVPSALESPVDPEGLDYEERINNLFPL